MKIENKIDENGAIKIFINIEKEDISTIWQERVVSFQIILKRDYNINQNNEEKFESLDGIMYIPIIKNGIYVCPRCEETIIPFNLNSPDSDYLYVKCLSCKMDFKIKNKSNKAFKLR